MRALEKREIERVGGALPIDVDVRIVAVTNRDLTKAIATGGFRNDLYYWLNVISATLPPLRERREDIPALIDQFLERQCHEVNRPKMRIQATAIDVLCSYDWPGNVRELQNVIERCTVLCADSTIRVLDLPSEIYNTPRKI